MEKVRKNVRKSFETGVEMGAAGLKAGAQLSLEAVQAVVHFKPPEAVFGAAPSLAMMREINGRKTTFRGAWFWYYYRVYYPYVFPPVFLLFMIVALTGWNSIEGHIVLGSILSLVSSLSVVISYIMIQPWQKHPSKLVLYRALTSVVFSLNLLFEAIQTDAASCRSYAVVTEVTLLGGECWLTTIALDLVYSLTNPFSSYKENMRRYQFMVWSFTGLLSFIFFFDNKCQGVFDKGVCWLQISNGTNSPCLWGYYLFWIIIMYIYQLLAAIFAYQRLNKGLPASFEVRKRCAQETFKCLTVYALYLSVLMFFFAIIAGQHADTNPVPGSSMANFALFFLFIVANRGSVDGVVWFMLHDFARDDPPKKEDILADMTGRKKTKTKKTKQVTFEALEQGDQREGAGASADESDTVDDDADVSTAERGRSHSLETMRSGIQDMRKNASKTFQELADLAIAEIDEADLSPQVNLALRQQIVQYVTRGVRDSIQRKGLVRPKDYDIKYYLDNILQDALNFETQDPAVTPGLEVFDFVMDEHPFKAFAPATFKILREAEGISDEKYLEVLSSNTKERLSEGASGAFMIFCGGGEFIVKTIRAREARVLHDSLPTYAAYLAANPDSFLCRFLGSYSLKMFSQTFYFVVMLNCFDPKAEINERFDIKGSWVGRSAEKEKGSSRTVCRHCNTYFIPSKKEKCDMIVGPHEANVVLKDNDLRVKISLQPLEHARVLAMLKKDSNLLGQLGVMDYSLLVGVKKRKFDVADIDVERAGAASSSSRSNHSAFFASSVTGPAVYHLGIVDFLQDWTRKKKIERAFKIYVARKDADGLSVMHPKHYKLRFQACMDQIFETSGVAVVSEAAGGRLVSRNPSSQSLPSMSEEVHNPLLLVSTAAAATDTPSIAAAAPPAVTKSTKTKKAKTNAAEQVPEEPMVLAPAGPITGGAVTGEAPSSLDDSFAEFSDMVDKTEYDML